MGKNKKKATTKKIDDSDPEALKVSRSFKRIINGGDILLLSNDNPLYVVYIYYIEIILCVSFFIYLYFYICSE